jgi:undecaprenyl-diphosphatase
VSRSAATIIGGLQQKLNRTQAAEFSFFLAVPTMFAATVYKMYKYQKNTSFTSEEINLLILGNVVAFIVAMIAIKAFISFLTKYGFKAFGYYRIALGLILLALLSSGVKLDIL